jgi:cardiolipin synthase
MISQVPNLLTLLRIAACPVLVLVLDAGNYEVALLLFLVAGITDGLDGYIAKRFNCASTLGAILDPIADKLLITSAYVMLALLGDIPFYLLVVVIFRDLVIIIGYFVLLMVIKGEVPIHPIYSSKVNTFLQIALVVFVLVEKSGWLTTPFPMVIDAMIIGVVVTSVFSGSQYVWRWGIKRDLS